MFQQFHSTTDRLIGRIVDFAQNSAWWVVLFSLSAAVATAHYTVNHLTINTNTEDMLSEELPWRVTRTAYKNAFPYFSDTIVIVVDAATADIARDAATRLVGSLRADNRLISDVYYPSGDEFLRRNQLLYLDTDDLASLVDKLGEAQPFLARLTQQRSSAALFELLGEAVEADLDGHDVALTPAISRISEAIAEFNQGNTVPMSWQALIMGAEANTAGSALAHREIILVRPVLDYAVLLPAEPAIRSIRQLSASLKLNKQNGVNIRLTGDAALSFDELSSVISGSQNAGAAALVMVLVCLIVGLRSLSLVVATLTALIVGLIFTAGFAVVCVSTLNMISIAFAVLYVGLGVDFAIHICLRYREMLNEHDPASAVNKASRHVGGSLILCALTTAIGFFAFIPTAYRGVAELGLIAGVGMFISLAVSIFLLPALLHILPVPRSPRRIALLPDRIASFPRRNARGVLAMATVIWIFASLTIPATDFDTDPINLNNPNAESVMAFRDLVADPERSPLAIAAVTDSRSSALDLIEKLRGLPTISSVRSIDSFVPSEQPEKLAMVDDLALMLGFDLELPDAQPVNAGLTLTSIDSLIMKLGDLTETPGSDLFEPALALKQSLTNFRTSLVTLTESQRQLRLAELEDKLLASFGASIELLRDGLQPQPVDLDNLPLNLRQRWLSAGGQFRLEAYPETDLSHPGDMQRFVAAARSVLGDSATGTPIINLGASDAVKLAFIQAFSYAFILITALLWIILRSIKETSIVLAPLILAGLITAAASVIFSLPFNFANIIALPLLLGIGVDSALHILHRYKTALPRNGNLLQTSTARGVFFSALTTIVSFGNLATSTHAGTASMGVMLTIGVISTLTCTLLVLPAILKQFMPLDPT